MSNVFKEKDIMKFDLSFWRFVIYLSFSKTWLWGRNIYTVHEEVYWFHIGTVSKDNQTALKIIILPVMLMIGFVINKGKT